MKNINMTSKIWDKESDLSKWNEEDIKPTTFYSGLMSKELQLFLAVVWLIVYVVCQPFETSNMFKQILGSLGLTFGFLCVLMFLIFHGVDTSVLLFGYVKRIVIGFVKWFFGLVAMLLIMVSCTDNQRARQFGGTETIKLPKGEKLILATWKGEKGASNLWYLTEPMDSSYIPKAKVFQESSDYGILEGKVIFQESK